MDPTTVLLLIILLFFIILISILVSVYYFAFNFFQSIFNSSHSFSLSLIIFLASFFFVTGIFTFISSIRQKNSCYDTFDKEICDYSQNQYNVYTEILIGISIIFFIISFIFNYFMKPKTMNLSKPVNIRKNI